MTKVYVSATFRDLQEHRAAVQLALRRLRVEDTAMESYVAEDRRPLERCLADVADCDVYIGIFAWRYGFIPPGFDRSITELEYREALAHGKRCLIFLVDEEAPWPRSYVDRGNDAVRIEAFRAELADRHMCSLFSDPSQLAAMVTAAVANVLSEANFSQYPSSTLGQDVLRRYFGRLRQHYGVLDLDVLTPAHSEEHFQLQLASVFVEQSVLPVSSGILNTSDRSAEPVDPWASPPQPLFDALADPEKRRIVLLGAPGSGKSTIIRYLALTLSQEDHDHRLTTLADHVPLLVQLRSYAALAADGRCEGFVAYLDYLARTNGLGIDRRMLVRHLRTGRTLVLFDGLDEVLDPRQREEVSSQIAGFATEFPNVRMVVSSRPYGYAKRVFVAAGFSDLMLQPLDAKQIAAFLSSWYRLTSTTKAVEEEAPAREARLLDAIEHSPSLREMAGNPMLLTILTIVGKHQVLPRTRLRIYRHATDLLIEFWDVTRHLRTPESTGFIEIEDKRELLRRVAYRMQEADNGLRGNDIKSDELRRVFEEYFVDRYQMDLVAVRGISQSLIESFSVRSGILTEVEEGTYRFAHRLFLEFFAADAIVTRFRRGELSPLQLRRLSR
ncbi:DUF4062 domain-containing protein [Micromonospora sp. WMMD1102]|uniref:DUF4062 domain-containing protein n=1 Tax=Micromonospora sp. WMMD1102 TaxID=3016105 RepID=UPI0024158B4D|nr:DUF4062 domain-containing protein [Micromonospora sp. WMMD1102]MDG4791230.1 DUF4062 domain-containing protein [Micromonospora sp. WMMD1102]